MQRISICVNKKNIYRLKIKLPQYVAYQKSLDLLLMFDYSVLFYYDLKGWNGPQKELDIESDRT